MRKQKCPAAYRVGGSESKPPPGTANGNVCRHRSGEARLRFAPPVRRKAHPGAFSVPAADTALAQERQYTGIQQPVPEEYRQKQSDRSDIIEYNAVRRHVSSVTQQSRQKRNRARAELSEMKQKRQQKMRDQHRQQAGNDRLAGMRVRLPVSLRIRRKPNKSRDAQRVDHQPDDSLRKVGKQHKAIQQLQEQRLNQHDENAGQKEVDKIDCRIQQNPSDPSHAHPLTRPCR